MQSRSTENVVARSLPPFAVLRGEKSLQYRGKREIHKRFKLKIQTFVHYIFAKNTNYIYKANIVQLVGEANVRSARNVLNTAIRNTGSLKLNLFCSLWNTKKTSLHLTSGVLIMSVVFTVYRFRIVGTSYMDLCDPC